MLPRGVLIFALCIPLAVLLGVMLATPLDSTSLLMVGSVFLVLLTPILMQHHHALLIFTWNAYVTAFFLPGSPSMWMVAAGLSFMFAVVTRTLNKGAVRFLHVPSIVVPLVLLGLIVFATAQLTGGIGTRAFGSQVFGGRRYVGIWAAILGYLAFTSLKIAPEKRQTMMAVFLLSSATALVGNIAYTLGESFYFLFLLFPAEWGVGQAAGEQQIGSIVRVTGLGPASTAVVCFMLMRYGLKGLLDVGRLWRGLAFLAAIAIGLYSGFRSHFVLVLFLVTAQFFAEKLHKTRYLMIALVATGLVTGFLVAFADTLPLVVQRTLTIFPLKLDPAAVQDARVSVEWRLEMWRVLLDEIPKYFWLGKGYAINPSDLYLSDVSVKLGVYTPYDAAIIAGDYHNGPLTLIIPFGIFGVLAFVAFLFGGGRALWKNYRYGDPAIQNINTFLLSLFIARVFFYCFIFGAFYIDIAVFAGIIGLSVAMNNGVAEAKSTAPATAPAPVPRPVRLPAWQPA